MNDFNWESFSKKIAVNANISDLYNAWTIPSEIEKWFLSKAEYFNPNGAPVPRTENVTTSDTYQWSWYLFDVVEKGKIIEANGTDLLRFSFAGDCKVEVKFTQNQDDVIVELTQRNIPIDDQSKKGIRLGCDSGWSFFLVNLKSVYEGGLDLRNKNESLKGMLNN